MPGDQAAGPAWSRTTLPAYDSNLEELQAMLVSGAVQLKLSLYSPEMLFTPTPKPPSPPLPDAVLTFNAFSVMFVVHGSASIAERASTLIRNVTRYDLLDIFRVPRVAPNAASRGTLPLLIEIAHNTDDVVETLYQPHCLPCAFCGSAVGRDPVPAAEILGEDELAQHLPSLAEYAKACAVCADLPKPAWQELCQTHGLTIEELPLHTQEAP